MSARHPRLDRRKCCSPYCRKPLQVSIIMMIFSQINGVNMILLYGPTILNDAGISFGSNSVLTSVPNYLTIFVATLISFPLIQRYSRRGFLIASTLGMALSHFVDGNAARGARPGVDGTHTDDAGGRHVHLGARTAQLDYRVGDLSNRVRSPALAIVCVFLFGSSFGYGTAVPDCDGLAAPDHRDAGRHVCRICAVSACSGSVFTWRMMPETEGCQP